MEREPDGPDRAGLPRGPCTFTVLLPILRPPTLLPFAVRSVLAQTQGDFELCILCDGAPDETFACAAGLAAADPRVRAFRFPKGARNGELHRDTLLRGAQSTFVAQIADDDLWFRDHLARLAQLLRRADFASLRQVRVDHSGSISAAPWAGHLNDPATRRRMLTTPWNFFGPSESGYRLSAYRSLPVGWSPAPPELASDLFMWRKFLSRPGLRLISSQDITGVKFAAKTWAATDERERVAMTSAFADALADADRSAALRRTARRALARRMDRREALLLLRHDPRAATSLMAQRAGLTLRRRLDRAPPG